MFFKYHMSGGAVLEKKYKLGGSIPNPGVPLIMTATTGNLTIGTTTSFAAAVGLAIDTGVYSATQATNLASLLANGPGYSEGMITCSVRPDAIYGALMSGGATEGTALTVMTNTSASAGGTVLTATIQSNDIDGGTLWCIGGNNAGLSRTITTHTSTTSLTVTVPFPYAIAVGDTFLACPWNMTGDGAAGGDGPSNVQTTTLITQADATSAAGTGGKVVVSDLVLKGVSDSEVWFQLDDQVFKVSTV